MALLKCDICGGSLTMEMDGEAATCDVCGMKHTKERLLIKLDETGAVKNDKKSDSLF